MTTSTGPAERNITTTIMTMPTRILTDMSMSIITMAKRKRTERF